MSLEIEKPAKQLIKPKLKKSIIDCDIHHNVRDIKDIFPYLPKNYREQIELWGTQLPDFPFMNGGLRGRMNNSYPPSGGNAGSDLQFMREQHLDPYNVEYGILTGEFPWQYASQQVDYAAALCSAYNDWTVEYWLEKDSRLRGSILIPIQDPNLAVKEIHRLGNHPGMVQVLAYGGARMPYGQRFYHPIYEACAQYGLPFTIHVGMEGVGINSAPTGVGYPSYYIEYRALRPQVYMAHLASFIFEGVFEFFPTFKVVLLEAGVFWVPPYLWRLDQDWKGLRHQTPWVKKPPSEYFKSNVYIGSQPIEETPNIDAFTSMLEWTHAKDSLLFCSDYPHWDYDSPLLSFPKLEGDLWEHIFYENARKLYKLPSRSAKQGGVVS
ncbi:amidohydrolase family protein [Paenibacillus alginolyticus]|uniref:Amidohydrolase family protein n=1 Tax=Paenibacillus alginolyticus TaxID=59839 RepID=A0ABT4GPN0_9BACL|nr:amidohydrolase family protein [Paenibacillus alginolyticus]MCY9698174.1 amidohydrolase family protein [Paenibacillus alginolyticus]MEC0146720.1 amidohydrolase family protein [Paenibacillus alginolyticus]